MKKNINKTIHCTRVTYKYVVLSTGKTGEHTTILPNWLKNETFILHQIQDEHIRVYSIDKIENITITYMLSVEEFLKQASADEKSVKVIKTIK